MEINSTNKIIIFGSGKIGRSFIGQIFSRAGYEVVFIDIYKPLIDELNHRGNYNVIIKSDHDELIKINNVRGIHISDVKKIVYEISTCRIMAVSVGLNGLNDVISLIAIGLLERYKINKSLPLDIIIAENMRNADSYFRTLLTDLLPNKYPFDKLIGLVETSIGKMVPIMRAKDTEQDILQVFAEPYNTLILDKKAFKNPIPESEYLSPKENMKAWVDRKLFIHNLGHAAAAYYGYLVNKDLNYIYEVLEIPIVYHFVRSTMLQSADILLRMYPNDFTEQLLIDHIDDLINRFQNKSLGDTIFRVGCDLMRKLGPEDRFVGQIKNAFELEMDYSLILEALFCGYKFRATDEKGDLFPKDIEFINIYNQGINRILSSVCEFSDLQIAEISLTVKNAESISK